MTDSKRTTVNLWMKKDKNGNVFLSGKRKDNNTTYYVFSDTKTGDKKLCSAAKDEDIIDIGKLERGENQYGEFFKNGRMFVSENRFYDVNDPFMKRKNGEYVLNKEGEKISSPEYQLVIYE